MVGNGSDVSAINRAVTISTIGTVTISVNCQQFLRTCKSMELTAVSRFSIMCTITPEVTASPGALRCSITRLDYTNDDLKLPSLYHVCLADGKHTHKLTTSINISINAIQLQQQDDGQQASTETAQDDVLLG